ncbi:hypothetical protein [Sorangium sp. So ce381]|uniref:hypothetical protein n=1 Tax=Sorangium sp. So ce381 TaxID=3133307 RepID=UPI003F5BE124
MSQKILNNSEKAILQAEAGRLEEAKKTTDELDKDAKTLAATPAKSEEEARKKNVAEVTKSTTDKTVTAKIDAVCGGGVRFHPCLYVGVFVASGSLTTVSAGDYHAGQTSHALVSAAIPAAGIRLPMDTKGRLSGELGLLSMLVSKDLAASERNGCRVANGDFEKRLPCEADATISPAFGAYLGVTLGTGDIGLLTLMGMGGAATTSLDRSLHPYVGLAVGLVNLSKTFNL